MTYNTVLDRGILDILPAEWPIDLLPEIRKKITGSKRKVIILDDDPTGTQTIHDLPVLTHWSTDALRDELLSSYPAFFILTNSRSLSEPMACQLAEEIGSNLRRASEITGVRIVPISRSDSTLRGHFPAEVDAMARGMGYEKLPYLILPFFLEGRRYTLNDVHYVLEDDHILVPAAQTPFALDSVFGFRHSNLKEWVEEKTKSTIKADEVTSITLSDIRLGGPGRVAEILAKIKLGEACIANAASYRDLEVVVTALLEMEDQGKEFLYRTAASFVRTRIGIENRTELLSREKLVSNTTTGGLFVIGSYVQKTGQQLAALIAKTGINAVEVCTAELLDPQRNTTEVLRIASLISTTLVAGNDTVLYTSRELISGKDAESNLKIGQTISDSLIEIIQKISVQPRYLLAKGGITSSDVATKALGVRRAIVLGQALPGVPVWQLGPETRFPGMAYIIFPGNVGDNDALVRIYNNLR